jgi:hypothetical protein
LSERPRLTINICWAILRNKKKYWIGLGFGMDDGGSSWVGSTIAFGGIVGSVFAG